MHARRALEDPELPHRYIVTVRGKGFRWSPGSPPARAAERHESARALGREPAVARAGREPDTGARRGGGMGADAGAAVLEGLHAARRLLTAARRLGNPLRRLDALLVCVEHLFALGRMAELERLAKQHARLAAELAHPGHLWFATVLEAARWFRAGQVTRAAGLLTRHLAAGRRAVGPMADAVVATHALNLAGLVGRPRHAMLRKVAALAARAATRVVPAGPSQLVAAVARLHLGDERGARRLLDSRAFEISTLPADRHLLPALVNLTDLAIAFRDGARLAAIYRRLAAHAGLRVCRDFADWGPVAYHAARLARGLGLAANSRRLTKLLLAQSRRTGAHPVGVF